MRVLVDTLESLHGDPLDRLLIAQALEEEVPTLRIRHSASTA
jgi:PIN domain nuclease of toxin-antitoxin system